MSDTESVERALQRWLNRWRGDRYTALFIDLLLWPFKLIPAYLVSLLAAAMLFPLFAFAATMVFLRSEQNGVLHTCYADNLFASFLATVSPRFSEISKIDPLPLRAVLFHPVLALAVLAVLLTVVSVRMLIRGGVDMGRGEPFPAPSHKEWPHRTLSRQTNLLVGYWVTRCWQFAKRVYHYPVSQMMRIIQSAREWRRESYSVPAGAEQVVSALLADPHGCRWVSQDEAPRILPLLVKLEELEIVELEDPDERGWVEVRLDRDFRAELPDSLLQPPHSAGQEPTV